VQNLA